MDQKEVNLKAFLKLIRYAEHKREDNEVYTIMYGGGTFKDTSTHPNTLVRKWGKSSTAAGAYQILYGSWAEAKKLGIVNDFSPDAQDRFAIWKLKTRGAYPFVLEGDVEKAVEKLRKEWTSLPGASQSSFVMSDAKARFQRYVTEYSKP
ncbi:glycoside hydrolase family 24 protein [Chitinimonas lacunae]|uniref:Lysozyme n=1 Tax=Chitinimonas lacunae TaxID=1963018 RepID=A0ABV8MT37_9NEIS